MRLYALGCRCAGLRFDPAHHLIGPVIAKAVAFEIEIREGRAEERSGESAAALLVHLAAGESKRVQRGRGKRLGERDRRGAIHSQICRQVKRPQSTKAGGEGGDAFACDSCWAADGEGSD